MLKRIQLYVDPKDSACKEIEEFLQKVDIIVDIRNIDTEPLNYNEVTTLFRHLDLNHFVDVESKAFKKHKLDDGLPAREETLGLMAEDNTLIKKPIVVAGRLMVVGCNIDKISEMLQINPNGSEPENSIGNVRRVEVRPRPRKTKTS